MYAWTTLLTRMLDAHELLGQGLPPIEIAQRLLNILLDQTGFYYGFVAARASGAPLALVGSAWNTATGAFFSTLSPTAEDRSLLGMVLRRGESVVTAAPRVRDLRMKQPEPETMLGVPLYEGETIWGVLGLAGRPDAAPAELLQHFEPIARAVARLLTHAQATTHPTPEMEEALTRSAAILETMPDAVLSIGMEGRIKSVNRAAQRIFGYRAEQLVGNHITLLLPQLESTSAEDMQTGDAHFFGTEHDLTGRRADGSLFPMEVTIARGRYEQRPIFIWIARDVSKLRAAELERERFFNLTPELLAIANFEGYFIRLNAAWEKTLGYTNEELTARPYLDFVHTDDKPETLGEATLLLGDHKVDRFENRYRCRDGGYRWLQWVGVRDESTQTVYAAARDITESRALREEIAQQHQDLERYSAGLKRLHRLSTSHYEDRCAMVRDHLQVGLDFLEVEAAAMFELKGSSIFLKTCLGDPGALGEEVSASRPLPAEELERVLQGRCVARPQAPYKRTGTDPEPLCETLMAAPLRVDGRVENLILFAARRGVRGGLRRYEIDIIDLMLESLGRALTARRGEEARHAATREGARLIAILEASPDLVAMLRPDAALLFLNRAGRRLLGIALDAPLHALRFTAALLDQGEAMRRGMTATMEQGVWTGELELRAASGETVPCSTILIAHREEDHTFSHFSAIFHDIRELKEVDRMKNEFISTVSHELRTPLTSLRGSLGLLVGEVMGPLPAAAHELLVIAQNNTERLIRLINDILDLEKIESGRMSFKLTALQAGELIDAALAGLTGAAAQARVTLRAEPSAPLTVQGDSDRLMQVLTNLVGNAIKFSPPESEVRVRASLASQGSLRVEVIDQGPGIPREARSRLFGKFQQLDSTDARQKGGTGLGLAISKAIVEGHGGEIGMEDAEGRGSVFFFTLPRLAPTSL